MELSKSENRVSFESILIFLVLFFPGISAIGFSGNVDPVEVIPFSAIREFGRTLTYTLPSLALIWYLASNQKISVKPKKKDIIAFSLCLPGLIIINIFVSVLLTTIAQTYGFPLPPKVQSPQSILGWMVMVLSCMGTGYLEESYFRCYLLSKLRRIIPSPAGRIFLSTFLFSMCHIPWGVLNAALAGIFLSVIFIRYRSLHGIALAHAVHNMFVYTMGAFTV